MKKAAILLVSCFVFVACPAERYWSFCSYNLTKQDLFFVYDFFPYDDAITPGKNYCRCIKALDSARFVESGRIERTLKDSAHIYLIDAQKESLPSNWHSLSKKDIELIKEESFVARMTVHVQKSNHGKIYIGTSHLAEQSFITTAITLACKRSLYPIHCGLCPFWFTERLKRMSGIKSK
jgi:hypothetical protein